MKAKATNLLDTLEVRGGTDTMKGGTANDTLIGDNFNAVVAAAGSIWGASVNLETAQLVNNATVYAAKDTANGEAGDDYLAGDNDTRVVRTIGTPPGLTVKGGALAGTVDVKVDSDTLAGDGGTNVVEQSNPTDIAKGLVVTNKVASPTTRVAASVPVIDWTVKLRAPLDACTDGRGGWTLSFVTELGRNELERNPNGAWRIRLS